MIIQTKNQIQVMVEALSQAKEIGFDFETTSSTPKLDWTKLHHKTAEITALSFASEITEPYFIPWNKIDRMTLIDTLRPVWTIPGALYIAHNFHFDGKLVAYYWDVRGMNKFDTLVASWYLDENRPKNLKDLLSVLLGWKVKKYKEIDVDNEKEFEEYSVTDAKGTLALYRLFQPLLAREGLLDGFLEVDMPFVDALIDMTLTGIPVNLEFLKEMESYLNIRKGQIEQEIYKVMGEFNIGSSNQLAEKLFGIRIKTKNKIKTIEQLPGELLITSAHLFAVAKV